MLPSLNLQSQLTIGAGPVDKSVKLTGKPWQPFILSVLKLATGEDKTTLFVVLAIQPLEPVIVKVAVNVPFPV